MPRKPFLSFMAFVLSVALVFLVTEPALATTMSSSKLLQSALTAAQEKGSVRFVDHTIGAAQQQLDGAISAAAASETLSGPAAAPLQVELIGGTVYVTGAAGGLVSALQISMAQATPVASKWIAVAQSDAPFQSLTGTLTLSSALNAFTPSGHLRLGKHTKVGGQSVIPIIGVPSGLTKGTSGSVALLVSTKAPHLPLGATLVLARGTQHLREVAVFTNWGAKVSLTAPTGAVPFSSVLSGKG